MKDKIESYFKGHGTHRLYYESVSPKNPRAVLILVHGLNEHIGRYEHVVDFFKQHYTVYLFDQRGHGQSDGIRSHVDSFDEYVEDLSEFVKLVHKKEGKKKIFLLGHSMGGQIVVNYLARHPEAPLAGFITSSANLRVKIKVHPLKKIAGLKLARYFPKYMLNNEIDPGLISRDKKVVEKYKVDPMVSKKVSVRLIAEMFANQQDLIPKADKIQLPGFLMHGGEDGISDKNGTVDFYERLAAKDKTLKVYEGMYHEIFNEIGYESVLKDVDAWIKNRS